MLIRRGALRELWEQSALAPNVQLAPPASDRSFWDTLDPRARERVLAEADAARARPWPQPLLSQWADYARTGDRERYEHAVFARNRRTRLAVLAAAIEPSAERVREASDGLWLKCEQSTWCWPAHDDAFGRGLMVPDTERPFVDLGAGEDAALAAWSVIVLGDALDEHAPGLRDRLRRETAHRVLRPFTDRRDWHWEGTEQHVHNWAPWIHGNLIPAAVAFADPTLRDRVIELCVDGIDRYLAQLPDDGGIDEGCSYWWQGAARAFDALGVLDVMSGGALRAAPALLGGLGELVRFPQRMQLGPDWFASFSDATARRDLETPWHSLYRAARLCGDAEAASFALACRGDAAPAGFDEGVAGGLGRMLAELADPDWWAADAGALPLPERVWLPSLGVGLRRARAGSPGGLAVLVKGGHNDENHNHNDLGSFAVAVDGVPLLPDLGRATYTGQTFSDERYDLWYIRSDWHSTALPAGIRQRHGRHWRADVSELDDGWSVDLSRAYPGADPSWVRTVRLIDGEVVVADESAALRHPSTRIIVVCVGAPAQLAEGILVPGREGSRDLLLTHDAADVQIETREIDDPYLRDSWGDRVSRMLFSPASGERFELRGKAR